jgi:hypothetical protein
MRVILFFLLIACAFHVSRSTLSTNKHMKRYHHREPAARRVFTKVFPWELTMRLRGGSEVQVPALGETKDRNQKYDAEICQALEDGGYTSWLEAWKLVGDQNRAFRALNDSLTHDCQRIVTSRPIPMVPR